MADVKITYEYELLTPDKVRSFPHQAGGNKRQATRIARAATRQGAGTRADVFQVEKGERTLIAQARSKRTDSGRIISVLEEL